MESQNPTTSDRILLKGHEPLSRTTIHGWPALAFGLLFALMGVPILAIGMEWIAYPKTKIHAPLWVIQIFGGFFLACGVWLMLHGHRGLRRIWNMKHGKRQMPNSPWLWDYNWLAQGTTDETLKKALGSLGTLVVFGVFLAPFNWLAFNSKYGSWFWLVLVGLFDVIILLGVGGRFLTKLRLYLTFGNSYLRFNSFPFFLGDTMSLTLKRVPADMADLQLDLRCIEEVYEISRSGRHRKSVVVCYQLYGDSQTIKGERIDAAGDLHISWRLPDNKALSSAPSERPARFWELEITADKPGINYHSRFLLPIYAPMS